LSDIHPDTIIIHEVDDGSCPLRWEQDGTCLLSYQNGDGTPFHCTGGGYKTCNYYIEIMKAK